MLFGKEGLAQFHMILTFVLTVCVYRAQEAGGKAPLGK